MLKRTKIYLVLTLLVLTGFAGSLHTGSLSSRERKSLVNDLKDTKKAFLNSIEGLSDAQLNFKPSPGSWSVKECAYHIALAENNLWELADKTIKEGANPEKRSEIKMTDEQLLKKVEDRNFKVKTTEKLEPENAKYKSLDEALEDFKTKRAALLKFVKTSTDDMRNHVAQMPFGSLDSYQVLLMIAAHTNRHTQQIEEVKANPNFLK
jgi:uncharacterized damage-inducible protein DinB